MNRSQPWQDTIRGYGAENFSLPGFWLAERPPPMAGQILARRFMDLTPPNENWQQPMFQVRDATTTTTTSHTIHCTTEFVHSDAPICIFGPAVGGCLWNHVYSGFHQGCAETQWSSNGHNTDFCDGAVSHRLRLFSNDSIQY